VIYLLYLNILWDFSLHFQEKKICKLQGSNHVSKLFKVSMRMDQCEHVISNQTIMNSLNDTDYDLVLADPSVMCGELIAAKLKTPFVYNVRNLFEQQAKC